jgi:hypothetical protein
MVLVRKTLEESFHCELALEMLAEGEGQAFDERNGLSTLLLLS